MSNIFNIRRTAYLTKKEMIEQWRTWLFRAAIVVGALTLYKFLNTPMFNEPSDSGHRFIMGFWVIVIACISFVEIHDKRMNGEFFLLPASTVEKVSVRIFLNLLVMPIFIVIVLLLGEYIAASIVSIFPRRVFFINILSFEYYLKTIVYLMPIQAVFILVGTFFKKHHVIKSLLVVGIMCAVLGFIIAQGINFIYDNLLWANDTGSNPGSSWERMIEHWNLIIVLLKVAFFGVLMPFCWIMTWARVRKVQSHEAI